jgi:hypothetical protein
MLVTDVDGKAPVLPPGQMAGANPAVRPMVWAYGIATVVLS